MIYPAAHFDAIMSYLRKDRGSRAGRPWRVSYFRRSRAALIGGFRRLSGAEPLRLWRPFDRPRRHENPLYAACLREFIFKPS